MTRRAGKAVSTPPSLCPKKELARSDDSAHQLASLAGARSSQGWTGYRTTAGSWRCHWSHRNLIPKWGSMSWSSRRDLWMSSQVRAMVRPSVWSGFMRLGSSKRRAELSLSSPTHPTGFICVTVRRSLAPYTAGHSATGFKGCDAAARAQTTMAPPLHQRSSGLSARSPLGIGARAHRQSKRPGP
jgi:hypothetical protein